MRHLLCNNSYLLILLVFLNCMPGHELASSQVSINRGIKNKPSYSSGFGSSGGGGNSGLMDGMMFNNMYSLSPNDTEELPDEQRLMMSLLQFYDSASRPVYNASSVVTISFSFALIQICDMDERNQILTISVWLEQSWYDERLLWNSSDYNYLDKIRLPCPRIWLPDIVLYNSADDFTEGYMQSKAMVKPDGEVFWSPPAKLRSSCKIDVTFFPFDDQVCLLKFGSWTYSGLQVDIDKKADLVDMSNYVENGEWELIEITIERNVDYYPFSPEEPFPSILFKIHLRRRVLYFLFNIIIPCIWLSILCLVGFWLPPDSGEKITLGITVLLAFSVFMLLIAENIPATSEMVPLIGIYLTITMSLASISIILTVFILQLYYANEFSYEVPRYAYNFMMMLGRHIGCMKKIKSFEECYKLNEEKLESVETPSNSNNLANDVKSKDKEQSSDEFNFCLTSCFCHCCFNFSNKISSKSAIQQLPEPADGHRESFKARDNQARANRANHIKKEKDVSFTLSDESNFLIPESGQLNNIIKIEKENEPSSNYKFNEEAILRNSQRSKAYTINRYQQMNPSMFFENRLANGPNKAHNKKMKNDFGLYQDFKAEPWIKRQISRHCSCHDKEKEYIKSLRSMSANVSRYIRLNELSEKNKKKIDEWKLIAYILDRFAFWVFTVVTVLFTTIILLVLPMMKNNGYFNTKNTLDKTN